MRKRDRIFPEDLYVPDCLFQINGYRVHLF